MSNFGNSPEGESIIMVLMLMVVAAIVLTAVVRNMWKRRHDKDYKTEYKETMDKIYAHEKPEHLKDRDFEVTFANEPDEPDEIQVHKEQTKKDQDDNAELFI